MIRGRDPWRCSPKPVVPYGPPCMVFCAILYPTEPNPEGGTQGSAFQVTYQVILMFRWVEKHCFPGSSTFSCGPCPDVCYCFCCVVFHVPVLVSFYFLCSCPSDLITTSQFNAKLTYFVGCVLPPHWFGFRYVASNFPSIHSFHF